MENKQRTFWRVEFTLMNIVAQEFLIFMEELIEK